MQHFFRLFELHVYFIKTDLIYCYIDRSFLGHVHKETVVFFH